MRPAAACKLGKKTASAYHMQHAVKLKASKQLPICSDLDYPERRTAKADTHAEAQTPEAHGTAQDPP
jgi:hypothetical protein